MSPKKARSKRRVIVLINYVSLLIVNATFYFVYQYKDMSHAVDAAGLLALLIVAITFVQSHVKSGLWKLTHSGPDKLDERELELTHRALGKAYVWFTVICLSIMLVHAVVYRLVPGIEFVITVPLVASLIYLAHTLPGSLLAWTEKEVPGDAS